MGVGVLRVVGEVSGCGWGCTVDEVGPPKYCLESVLVSSLHSVSTDAWETFTVAGRPSVQSHNVQWKVRVTLILSTCVFWFANPLLFPPRLSGRPHGLVGCLATSDSAQCVGGGASSPQLCRHWCCGLSNRSKFCSLFRAPIAARAQNKATVLVPFSPVLIQRFHAAESQQERYSGSSPEL